ncbi:MAG TPA: phospholipid carrier-dependent glycosyltransferase [Dermatophilaceae bacterium]|nr:phospholipid carrier-dependent glycosyltransferase [Dermatophilaceae bacterium]
MARVSRAEQLRWRLLGYQPSDTLLGWAGPGVVALVGGLLRFWQLGSPHRLVFDETYYVKQAYSMLKYGIEMRSSPDIQKHDEFFTNGTPDVFGKTADFVAHPPAGKWVIALGEQLFGVDSSFGWRFSVALLGTVSILMVGRAARRLFGSTFLGIVAAMLLAFEGHHFVHSRTGLLDLIVMFFGFAGFCALLIDRDRSREVLSQRLRPSSFGPWLGWRPWRWAAGVLLGLGAATKWSGVFFLAVFALMSVLWDAGARRAASVPRWWLGAVLRDGPYAALSLVGAGLVTYVASWFGWFRSTIGYDRHWAEQSPGQGPQWLPAALRSLWKYHQEMYSFNVGLNSGHPYRTNPWSWLILGRPTSFDYQGPKRGEAGCTVALCSKAITSIGTPTIWWGATIAVFVLLFMWALRRDWRAGAVLAGLAGGYLPWFQYQDRTIYSFYTIAFVPWLVLACTYVLGLWIGGPTASPRRRRAGLVATCVFVVGTVALFTFFYPVYTSQLLTYPQWRMRMWFPSWI